MLEEREVDVGLKRGVVGRVAMVFVSVCEVVLCYAMLLYHMGNGELVRLGG